MKTQSIKFVILIVISSLMVNQSQAQGAYFNVRGAYYFGTQGMDGWNSTNSNTGYTDEHVNIFLGKGINAGADIGYMVNQHIGFELGCNYLLGGKSTMHYSSVSSSSEETIYSRMLRFNPSLIIATDYHKLHPYAKFGFIIGKGFIMTESIDHDMSSLGTSAMKYYGGLEVGTSAGLGCLYDLSKHLSLFVELNSVHSSYAPNKGKLTESTLDGVDQLPLLTTSEKEMEFQSSVSNSQLIPPQETNPSQQLKFNFLSGAIGTNVGIRIRL